MANRVSDLSPTLETEDSDDESTNSIVVDIEIADAHTVKTFLETISYVSPHGLLYFTEDGIRIMETNTAETISISIFLNADEFLGYDVKRYHNGTQVRYEKKEFKFYLNTDFNSLAKMCKLLGKGLTLHLRGLIEANDIFTKMNVIREIGFGNISCNPIDMTVLSTVHVDMLRKYYGGKRCTAKIIHTEFTKTINLYKSRGCSAIVFSLEPDNNVYIKGFKSGEDVDVVKCHVDESAILNDVQLVIESADDEDDSGFNIVMEAYKVVIDFKQTIDIFSRLSRFSTTRSVIHIYIDVGKPLILKVNAGVLGQGVFTFMTTG